RPARPFWTGGTPIPQTCGSYLILIPKLTPALPQSQTRSSDSLGQNRWRGVESRAVSGPISNRVILTDTHY
ncbi:hypothetical protein, partial [Microcoleus sp. B13-B6]|uniref:hypothetical protein n=1 Tax=Microcoleus sp. B13-B6 TaxID=2818652 RepID=UPI002FCF3B93